jgi:hypothetical protein
VKEKSRDAEGNLKKMRGKHRGKRRESGGKCERKNELNGGKM